MRFGILASILLLSNVVTYGQHAKIVDQKADIKRVEIQYEGKLVKAYQISVTSIFDHEIDYFFQKEMNPANTLKITKPLAHIKLLKGADHQEWRESFTYELKIRTLGFIPFGGIHYIFLERVDEENREIQTREHNNVAKVWDHLLKFKKHEENMTAYTDQVTLYAGNFGWIFARYLRTFYKMRHRKWNKLLNEGAFED